MLKTVLITGVNEQSIENETSKTAEQFKKHGGNVLLLEYPEYKRHNKEVSEYVYTMVNHLKELENSLLIIKTFSESIANFFGLMIAKNKISYQNVEFRIAFDYVETLITHYDESGHLQRFPIGFFSHIDFEN